MGLTHVASVGHRAGHRMAEETMNQPRESIWKFPLETNATEQRYNWPFIIEVLRIEMQDGVPVLWARVYPDTAKRLYKVLRFLTGDLTYGISAYLGTVTLPSGDVLHYFSGGLGL